MYFFLALLVSYGAAGVEWFIKHNSYTAVSYTVVVPFALLIPRLLYRIRTVKPGWLSYVEKMGFILVLLNAIGTVYFHTAFFSVVAPSYQYDRVLHLTAGFLIVPLLMMLWIVTHGKWGDRNYVMRWALFLGIIGLFGWEAWQFFSDRVFGSNSFHDGTQGIVRDFWEDVAFGFLGNLLAIPYVRRMIGRFRSFIR